MATRGILGFVVCAACVACAAAGAACGLPPAGPAAPAPAPPRSLADIAPRLAAGEQTAWNVFYQGVPIGRADLIVDGRAAHTTFRASRAARVFAAAHLELATALEGGQVRGVRELLTLGGATERAEAVVDGARYTLPGGEERGVPGGGRLHTLHSALGVLRAWSAERVPAPGYLWVWSGGRLYRLDVARPARDAALGVRALRVDGTVRAPHLTGAIALELWLAANPDRTLLRLSLRDGSHRLAAEVYESTSSLDAR